MLHDDVHQRYCIPPPQQVPERDKSRQTQGGNAGFEGRVGSKGTRLYVYGRGHRICSQSRGKNENHLIVFKMET